MKILITGGAGFIGSNIARGYLAAGHRIAILDDFSTGKEENVPDGVPVFRLPIESPEVADVLSKFRPEVVNHHAAQIDIRKSVHDPVKDATINILGSLNLFECCLKTRVKKIIFASTGGAIYGNQASFPASENHPANPASPYGIVKLAVEKYLQYYSWTHHLPFVALRYANVYGPRQNPHGEAGVIAIFIHKLLNGERPVIFGNGLQTRDYIFIDDVVACNLEALKPGITGIHNVGTEIETDLNALTAQLVQIIGSSMTPVYTPPKAGEQMRSCLKKGILQNHPLTPLPDGLKKTVEWFKSNLSSRPDCPSGQSPFPPIPS